MSSDASCGGALGLGGVERATTRRMTMARAIAIENQKPIFNPRGNLMLIPAPAGLS